MRKTIAIFILILLTVSPVASQAEIREDTFSLSPFIGGYTFDGGQNLDTNAVYGLRGGYNFTKNWAMEAAFGYVNTDLDRAGGSVDVYRYGLDALYHFMPEGKLVPFLAVGAGAMTINGPDSMGDEHGTFASVNVGGGLKYFISDNLALRADIRDIVKFNETQNNIEYTVGITFYFGGSKPAPVSRYEAIAEPTPEPVAKKKVEEKVVIMASEPKVEEKVMVAAAEPKIIILAFEDVHFDFDQSTLKPEAQTILKRNIQLLKDNPKAQIRIAGYTSASGTEAYNQKLSERRANAVKAYLVNEGIIASDRLSIIGYGKTHPAVYEAAPKELYSEAAKANMRVLFEIIVQ
jgi:OOP family OmpA-OmpF porin